MKEFAKPFFTFYTLTLLAIMFFAACTPEDDDDLAPTLEVTFSNGSAIADTSTQAGQPIEIRVVGMGNSDNITYYSILRNGIHVLDSGLNSASFVSVRSLIRSTDSIETYTIIIRDRNFRESSFSFCFGLKPTSSWGNIRLLENIILGAQNNSSTGSFLNLSSGNIYNLSTAFQNQDSAQMLYFYDGADLNTIASPNANIDTSYFGGNSGLANWTIKNEIRFVQLFIGQQDFLDCQNDSLIIANLFPYETGKRKAKQLTSGNVYEFCFHGKYGIFYVNNVSGTNSGTIDISIKMQ
ncbi:MAG: hypothetical protein CVU11_12720 [Bacteroidetes bacterium HGW-Bacteroidetes-6]|jgi:hypothetical protein|nr:MAG: hypothetical protein CVU11_12720 [Bacteroidetes bacterium HGW-Bacteroidetes-6]